MNSAPIYSIEQIRAIEQRAYTQYGITPQLLMERAGRAACDFLLTRWPKIKKVSVVCGRGNNGGDGYVLARHAFQHGVQVIIWQVGGEPNDLNSPAWTMFVLCQQIPEMIIRKFSTAYYDDRGSPCVIVDALYGIGLRQSVREEGRAAIEQMNQQNQPIFAIDVPSGVDAETGACQGEVAVQAMATLTFIGLKLGILTGPGRGYSGEIVYEDLQLPQACFASIPVSVETITLGDYEPYLRPRPRNWHKGRSGKVLVVGGGPGMAGAPLMTALAALRVGAGLVTIITHTAHADKMHVAYPEVMCRGIDKKGCVSDEPTIIQLLHQATVVVLGPGLGQSKWAKQLWEQILREIAPNTPLVMDADGLNWLSLMPQFRSKWVLTPHPGEASRLLKCPIATLEMDRNLTARTICERYGGICVLKGAGSLVVTPSHQPIPAICLQGNPGMASAGMGDILSGVIGGLVAQGVPPPIASKLGVCLHASAGDGAAKTAGERGMLATDLLPYLRQLVNESHRAMLCAQ